MTQKSSFQDVANYKIVVKGILGQRWFDWFEDMIIESHDGLTTIDGQITDQAALHRILVKIRDLGLVLISVNRSEVE